MPIRGVVAPDTSDPLITAGAGEDSDLAQAVAVGILGPDESDCWDEIGQPVSLAQRADSVLAQVSRRTVIGVTAAGMETVVAEGYFPTTTALLWVLPDSFALPDITRDLVAFWNYRALRLWHWRTVTVMARQSQLREPETRRRLVDAITASTFSTPMCVVNGLAVPDEDLRIVAEELGFEVVEPGTWSERHSSRPEPLKRTAVINVPIAAQRVVRLSSPVIQDPWDQTRRPRSGNKQRSGRRRARTVAARSSFVVTDGHGLPVPFRVRHRHAARPRSLAAALTFSGGHTE